MKLTWPRTSALKTKSPKVRWRKTPHPAFRKYYPRPSSPFPLALAAHPLAPYIHFIKLTKSPSSSNIQVCPTSYSHHRAPDLSGDKDIRTESVEPSDDRILHRFFVSRRLREEDVLSPERVLGESLTLNASLMGSEWVSLVTRATSALLLVPEGLTSASTIHQGEGKSTRLTVLQPQEAEV
jgi:hypothetical protein